MPTNEELALKVQQGDQEATAQLWEQVSRLVFKLLGRFYPLCPRYNLDVADLEQEGYFAVLDAAKDFNPEKGYLFTSYLDMHVRNAAKSALGLRGHATRPQNVRSLNEPLPGMEDEGVTLADTIPDESAAAEFERVQEDWQRAQLRTCLDDCMSDMQPDQAFTLRIRYYEGKTLQATADKIGTNRERVRQLEAKGLRHMRKPRNTRQLRPFLYESIQAQAYKGTGLQAFRDRQGSSVELIFERMDTYEQEREAK